ncbi:MAG TPA: hypothetical protein VGP46_13705, partial [Acidimicrobiales bacterium]|nr:hypothetical protein [Acidimicrobiales bacterium]
TLVSGIVGVVVQIASSNSDGYALTSGGAVWSWGVGSAGELGDGATVAASTTAVKVDFPAGVKIAALANPMPFDGALAIDTGHRAWAWGLDAGADLCLAGAPDAAVLRPRQIPLGDITLATGARTHSLLDSGGRLYACGSGEGGALGDGSMANSTTPALVDLPAGADVTALTSSWEGSGALLGNGDYYDWGYNAAGQLGDGNTGDSDRPQRVNLPAAVRQVSQGGSGPTNGQTVAILADGSVWAWGNNKHGQLGDGAKASSDVPVRLNVPAGVKFVTVDSGGYACYAIDGSGHLWAWGGNQNGQLGTGGAGAVTDPVEVGISLTQISSTASNVAGFDRRP